MKSVSLECGGKSANIIFSDAPNLDFAINQAAWGMFYNSGQVCDAASRLVIDEKIKDEFLEKIINLSKEIKPTNPLDPGTTMGSMVDKIQTDRVMKYIDIGKQEGAKVVLGGKQVNQSTGGFYIEPTIFDNVKNDMKVAQEEIFGPVLSTITFRNEEEAATIGNETVYGLQSAVWTKDINKAHRVAKSLRSGKVMINTWDGGDITTPHGGFKQSGFGVDKSLHAIDKYTQLKLTWIAIDSSNSNGDGN
jgi:acyl-CoA reductase-like NAD-dependent aldehyde dehydrogenase